MKDEEEEEPVEKEKPSFALSGALAEETNKVQGETVQTPSNSTVFAQALC